MSMKSLASKQNVTFPFLCEKCWIFLPLCDDWQSLGTIWSWIRGNILISIPVFQYFPPHSAYSCNFDGNRTEDNSCLIFLSLETGIKLIAFEDWYKSISRHNGQISLKFVYSYSRMILVTSGFPSAAMIRPKFPFVHKEYQTLEDRLPEDKPFRFL